MRYVVVMLTFTATPSLLRISWPATATWIERDIELAE